MADVRHTPGPWVIELQHEADSAGDYPATYAVYTEDGSGLIAENVLLGDARVITAAPGLLAALKRMLAAHDADVAAGSLIAAGNMAAADEARAAIAKATGKDTK